MPFVFRFLPTPSDFKSLLAFATLAFAFFSSCRKSLTNLLFSDGARGFLAAFAVLAVLAFPRKSGVYPKYPYPRAVTDEAPSERMRSVGGPSAERLSVPGRAPNLKSSRENRNPFEVARGELVVDEVS